MNSSGYPYSGTYSLTNNNSYLSSVTFNVTATYKYYSQYDHQGYQPQTLTGSCTVSVEPGTNGITGVKLNKTSDYVAVGGSTQLNAVVYPTTTTNQAVTWTSDRPGVASVSSTGLVTGVSTGTAYITATSAIDSSKSATCVVTVSNGTITLNRTSVNVAAGSNFQLYATVNSGISGDTVTWTSNKPSLVSVDYNTGLVTVPYTTANGTTARITATASKSGAQAYCDITVAYSAASVSISSGNSTSSITLNGSTAVLYANLYGANYVSNSTIYYKWSSSDTSVAYFPDASTSSYYGNYTTTGALSSNGSSSTSVRIAPGGKNGTATISVYAYYSNSASSSNYIAYDTFTVYGSNYYNMSVGATVYEGNVYSLGATDDEGGTSIVDQIWAKTNWTNWNDYRSAAYVRFSSTTSTYGTLNASTSQNYYIYNYNSSHKGYYLSDVTFTPKALGSSSSQTASFNFTLYDGYNSGAIYSGVMTFTVKPGGSGGTIEYACVAGEDTDFYASDFQSFWTNMYSRGSLSYVVFTSVSSGKLTGANGSSLSVGANGTKCYVSPSSSQTGLNDVNFVGSSNSTIRFTAYGYTGTSSSYSTSRTGTVTISYVKECTTPITYNLTSTSSKAVLGADDFSSLYKSFTGSNSTNIRIRFTSVPTLGTLSYNSTTLTSSNIDSYTFSAKSSGSNRISDVSYTPSTSGTDSATFVCYNGSTPRFVGQVRFITKAQVVNNLTVAFTSGANGVTFDPMKFYNAHDNVRNCSFITFNSPSSGSLSSGSAAVTANTRFGFSSAVGVQSLSTLSYKPAAAFNGTATIPFYAYDASGNVVAQGSVQITVSQPVVTAPSFSDIGSHWAKNEISSLASAGVIQGDGNGKFRPDDNTSFGEALKMIMMAAGYQKLYQPTGAGVHWADNYLSTAISDGLLPSSAADMDLDAPIDRITIGQLAAKAMKLPAATGSSPFTDTSDPYIIALYNAGIVKGYTDGSYANARTNMTRGELCTVVYRIYNYNGSAATPETETEEPTTPSVKPGWL